MTPPIPGYIGGMAVDAYGDIFISDEWNNVVWKIDYWNHDYTIVAGGGTPDSGIGDGGNALRRNSWLASGTCL